MKYITFIIVLLLFTFPSFSQQIIYSTPGARPTKNSYYNLIGKVKQNILLYTAENTNYSINVYDNNLELKDNVNLPFLSKRNINTEFIQYPDFFLMIYSYLEKSTIYCMGVKMDENAAPLSAPIILDSTKIKVADPVNIYSVIKSEDKSKFIVLKIQKQPIEDQIIISSSLYNENLDLQDVSILTTDYNSKTDIFNNFSVSNKGDFAFTKNETSDRDSYPGSYILKSTLFFKPASIDSFNYYSLNLSGKLLKELRLKIDNLNDHFILNSFYSSKVDIEGLYTAVWNSENKNWFFTKFTELGKGIRETAKSQTSTLNSAFNNFHINDIILEKGGGFILTAEDVRTNYSSQPVNTPADTIAPSSYLYYSYRNTPYNIWQNINSIDYSSNYGNEHRMLTFSNVVAIKVDSTGNLLWGNVLPKTQYENKNSANLFSYSIMLKPTQAIFLYNEPYKQKWILNNKSISNNGDLIKNPVLTGLLNDYLSLPLYAKQIDKNNIVMPCLYKGRFCLSKIDIP